jgi:hypothetical protein
MKELDRILILDHLYPAGDWGGENEDSSQQADEVSKLI